MLIHDRQEKIANAVQRIADVSAELHLTLGDLERALEILRQRTYITGDIEPAD